MNNPLKPSGPGNSPGKLDHIINLLSREGAREVTKILNLLKKHRKIKDRHSALDVLQIIAALVSQSLSDEPHQSDGMRGIIVPPHERILSFHHQTSPI